MADRIPQVGSNFLVQPTPYLPPQLGGNPNIKPGNVGTPVVNKYAVPVSGPTSDGSVMFSDGTRVGRNEVNAAPNYNPPVSSWNVSGGGTLGASTQTSSGGGGGTGQWVSDGNVFTNYSDYQNYVAQRDNAQSRIGQLINDGFGSIFTFFVFFLIPEDIDVSVWHMYESIDNC